ncbi:MAG TPA: NAD(P)-binding domain-containing protein [Gaiellaceae bacterium]|jgi:ornithine cyclodeaminase|nr:NAD(P)-binding domain-containing protein [Gaiellaceae bacterium]
MLNLNEPEIRNLVNVEMARKAVEGAFRALHRGEATVASVISLPFRAPDGVAHIKAGHLHDDAVWTVKVSADFDTGGGGGTCHSGLMLVISAIDGTLVGVLADNGYLTELRTGAAGAIAADLLARRDATTVAIIGAGSQARYQLEALLEVRSIEEVRVASRSPQRAQAFVDEIAKRELSARLCESVEEAVRGADIVITTTPSTVPIVNAEWLDAGTHVTAVGSDEPNKQELAPAVLARAAVIAVDDRRQAASFGELHHAIEQGVRTEEDVVTLGELLEGAAHGRVEADDITVADLTGVGVQDAAIAALVLREATDAQVAHLEPRNESPVR